MTVWVYSGSLGSAPWHTALLALWNTPVLEPVDILVEEYSDNFPWEPGHTAAVVLVGMIPWGPFYRIALGHFYNPVGALLYIQGWIFALELLSTLDLEQFGSVVLALASISFYTPVLGYPYIPVWELKWKFVWEYLYSVFLGTLLGTFLETL